MHTCMKVLAAAVLLGGICTGQLRQPTTPPRAIITPGVLQWKPFLPGAELAVLQGNPNEEGVFTIRMRIRAGTQIPPHFHSGDENITVLKGTFGIGMGKKFDERAIRTMTSGAFITVPKSVPHFCVSHMGAIVQIHGTGPFVISSVDNH
jgi:anti-sigma factor ChrR (cupin superfamily)